MKRQYIYLLIILAGALLTGCGASKKSVQKELPVQETPAVNPAATLEEIATSYKSWLSVEVPVKVEITSPVSFGCSARVQMIRNQWLGISVRMLGFEVAYLTADNDSVHAYAKMQKIYLSESLDKLFGSTGYNLGNLQDLLLGRLFVPGSTTASAYDVTRFVLGDIDGLVTAVPSDQPESAQIGFIATPDPARIVAATIESGAHAATVTYEPGAVTAAGPIAAETTIAANMGAGLSAVIKWDVKGSRWDRDMTPRRWKIPGGARRVKVTSDLLKKLVSQN